MRISAGAFHYIVMQQYDTRLKSILYRSMPQLFRLLGLPPPVAEFLSVEFPLHEKVVSDWVVRLIDGRILHLELKSRNDGRMLWRSLEYWKAIAERWPEAEIVVVIYVGDAPMTMVNSISRGKNHYEFDIISFKDIEAREFLESDSAPERMVAVLCRSEDPRATIKAILASWKHLPEKELIENFNDLAVLSQLRKRDTMGKEAREMPIEIDLRENAFVKCREELGEA